MTRAAQTHPDTASRLDALSPDRRALLERLMQQQPVAADDGAMSPGQQSLWFIDRLDPGNRAYNLPMGLRLRGNLNRDALAAALRDVAAHHDSLRTGFEVGGDGPRRKVWPKPTVDLRLIDLTDVTAQERQAALASAADGEAAHRFDLLAGPPVRAALVRLGEADHALLLTVHHIVFDGVSLNVVLEELALAYRARAARVEPNLPAVTMSYGEWVGRQRRWAVSDGFQRDLAWWIDALAEPRAILDLPPDRPRPASQRFAGDSVSAPFPGDLHDALTALSRREGATLFMTLLAAWMTLLHRYGGQTDQLIGCPVANRADRDTQRVVGFLANNVVLRTSLEGDPSFTELLGRVRETTLAALGRAAAPFASIVDALKPPRDPGRNPLFQASFNLIDQGALTLDMPGLAVEPMELTERAAKFDLTLYVVRQPGRRSLMLNYDTDLFDAATMRRMLVNLQVLLQGIAADPAQRLSRLAILGDGERRAVVEGFNRTGHHYPGGLTLTDLLDAQAGRTPDAEALRFEGESLTYRQLHDRGDALARRLREAGAGPDVLAGVHARRSVEMVVALLGVLKAGAAYVPLDPDQPPQRLSGMIGDARCPIVLTQGALAASLPRTDALVMELDGCGRAAGDAAGGAPIACPAGPDDLAYTIFTSGSTGRPKGVMNTHRGIVNRLLWMQERYHLDATDRVMHKTPFGFDVSVWEFFWPLMTGAPLVVAQPGGHRDPDYLAGLVGECGITTMHFVPSMLQAFLAVPDLRVRCPSLRRVICSGEALSCPLQQQFFERLPGVELHNLYGPTEAAVDVTHHACDPAYGPIVPIGRPVANTRIYILDGHGQPTPIGVAGELHIGGAQVARGYVGRPDLTAERFVPDPFATDPGARLYRTGDLARHLADGNVQYLGRMDGQVKVRGHRIELGEIEAALESHPAVRQAAVAPRRIAEGDERLAAWLVAQDPDRPPTAEALRAFLADRLPPYMVPAAFTAVERLPVSPSGKLDRGALPDPAWAAAAPQGFVAPADPLERAAADLFRELLRAPRVGMTDGFFDLGGHSLLATRLVARFRDTFGVELSLREVFAHPTPGELLAWLLADPVRGEPMRQARELLGQIETMSESDLDDRLVAEGSRHE